MRAKVILSVSVLAVVVLAPAVYFHYKSSEPVPEAAPVASDDSTNAAPVALTATHHRVAAAGNQASVPDQTDPAADLNSPEHQEYVTQRKAELYEMGVSKEPSALRVILADVHNPDPEIRETALSATMDFGDSNAIPALKSEMTWAEDPKEKVEIQKAIDFLQVPTFALDASGRIADQ